MNHGYKLIRSKLLLKIMLGFGIALIISFGIDMLMYKNVLPATPLLNGVIDITGPASIGGLLITGLAAVGNLFFDYLNRDRYNSAVNQDLSQTVDYLVKNISSQNQTIQAIIDGEYGNATQAFERRSTEELIRSVVDSLEQETRSALISQGHLKDVRFHFDKTESRLNEHINKLYRNSNINLLIGISTTLISIVILDRKSVV